MLFETKVWLVLSVAVVLAVRISLTNRRLQADMKSSLSSSGVEPLVAFVSLASGDGGLDDFFSETATTDVTAQNLEYDFYRDTCPRAEKIVRTKMAWIYGQHRDVSAQLLRLFFHDCFIEGCDASVLLDDSNGNQNHAIEKQAIPNRSLKGFDKIDEIKERLENECPGVVSCADVLALATRDAIVLAGGPFYPILTGRRDSTSSFFNEAMTGIPRPDDNINQTLHQFSLRGFDERETVALLGGHNIGKIGCEFIMSRINNFKGTGQPDPTIPPEFVTEMRLNCDDDSNQATSNAAAAASPFVSRGLREKFTSQGMSYYQQLSSSFSTGAGFDSHYYQSLLRGRGLLFADQQLMANKRTARVVTAYASDGGSAFRMDFARAMMKMSVLNVLTGSQGEVRFDCSLPTPSS
ncbi:PREDICTED: putative Peroxidase 48 [Fragaria vesca subsp. vesca]|uniref:putative Peroxidase 48 n=1 Tax=Fragaria vesca subsp. vesca TaxID=101020 RepID=UPI0002C2F670|nr:PREDICTED: putative Peroxidase 48 [Fragaria vesca subsp. vesca]